MREQVGDRLPKFSQEDKKLLENSIDFVGLNHYTSRFIAHGEHTPEEGDVYKAQQMDRIGNVNQLISESFYIVVLLNNVISFCQFNGKVAKQLVKEYVLSLSLSVLYVLYTSDMNTGRHKHA